MKTSSSAGTHADDGRQAAVEFLELVPAIMGYLRCEMQHHEGNNLTLVQFRVLVFVDWTRNASMSCIANFLGIGLPTTSKVVDGLVNAGLVTRRTDDADRRRVVLDLTDTGRKEAASTREIARDCLARMLGPLSPEERTRLREGLRPLRSIFLKPIGAAG